MDEVTVVTVIGEPLEVMKTFCDVVPDPTATLKDGFWLAAKPNPVPVPTFTLTVKVVEPAFVVTETVPV